MRLFLKSELICFKSVKQKAEAVGWMSGFRRLSEVSCCSTWHGKVQCRWCSGCWPTCVAWFSKALIAMFFRCVFDNKHYCATLTMPFFLIMFYHITYLFIFLCMFLFVVPGGKQAKRTGSTNGWLHPFLDYCLCYFFQRVPHHEDSSPHFVGKHCSIYPPLCKQLPCQTSWNSLFLALRTVFCVFSPILNGSESRWYWHVWVWASQFKIPNTKEGLVWETQLSIPNRP